MRAAARHRAGRPPSPMRPGVALILAIALNAGCAGTPVDDVTEYRRADARIRATEEFESLKQACRAAGGVIFVNDGGGRLREPSLQDLRMAKCVWGGRL